MSTDNRREPQRPAQTEIQADGARVQYMRGTPVELFPVEIGPWSEIYARLSNVERVGDLRVERATGADGGAIVGARLVRCAWRQSVVALHLRLHLPASRALSLQVRPSEPRQASSYRTVAMPRVADGVYYDASIGRSFIINLELLGPISEASRRLWSLGPRQEGDAVSHLRALGLVPGATPGEIKAAFRRLAMQHHPDHGGDGTRFAQLRRAYEALI